MSQLKKIIVSVPDSLLEEIDTYVSNQNINRSEFVREAMKMYIKDKNKLLLHDKLEKGYKEMSKINLEMSRMCFEADNEALFAYEEKLSECE